MRSATLVRVASCIASISVSVVAGCGTLQPPIDAPGQMVQARATAAHHDRGGSWMRPNTSKALLYYDDDITDDTYVYDYPSGEMVGKLTGFDDPQGMCVDQKGDVYITNPPYGLLLEYAHGGTKPINVYERPGSGLGGCSVSPTGAVAATGGNEVCIWKGGISRNVPTCIAGDASIGCTGLSTFGYDHDGNLIGMGISFGERRDRIGVGPNRSKVTACIIRAGAGTMEKLSTPGIKLHFSPRGTAWDGEYIALCGLRGNGDVVRPVRLTGTMLVGVGPEVKLKDQAFMPGSPFFFGKQNVTAASTTRATNVTIANPRYEAAKGAADFWNYPKGGEPAFRILSKNDSGGDAISIAE